MTFAGLFLSLLSLFCQRTGVNHRLFSVPKLNGNFDFVFAVCQLLKSVHQGKKISVCIRLIGREDRVCLDFVDGKVAATGSIFQKLFSVFILHGYKYVGDGVVASYGEGFQIGNLYALFLGVKSVKTFVSSIFPLLIFSSSSRVKVNAV